MDKKHFVPLLDKLANTFGVELRLPRIEAYWELLGDMPDDVFAAACRACMIEEQFFPVPATIIRYARTHAGDGEACEREWQAVLRAARSYTPIRGPWEPEDVAAARALRAIGGVGTVAHSDAKQVPWLRKEFAAEYAVAARAVTDGHIGVSSGDDLPALAPGNVRQLRGGAA